MTRISACPNPLHARAIAILLQSTGPLTTGDVARQLGTSLTDARNALDRIEQRDELDGPWEAYAAHWVRLREGVAELVANGFPAPCSGRVIAWGGGMDDHIAVRRGLVRARCAPGSRNTAWQWPDEYATVWAGRAVVSAQEASGSR